MNKYLTSSDLAQRVGASVRTIHRFERAGLIPAPQRTPGGWRIYTDADVEPVRRIVFPPGDDCDVPVEGQLFPIGEVETTPAATAALAHTGTQLEDLLARHVRGEWGSSGTKDALRNSDALHSGSSIVSIFRGGSSTAYVLGPNRLNTPPPARPVFVIETDPDRRVTRVYLQPEWDALVEERARDCLELAVETRPRRARSPRPPGRAHDDPQLTTEVEVLGGRQRRTVACE